jgi:hypothetical protein
MSFVGRATAIPTIFQIVGISDCSGFVISLRHK